MVRTVPQRMTELLEGGGNAVIELHHRTTRPEGLVEFFPRDHFGGMFQQEPEHLERLVL